MSSSRGFCICAGILFVCFALFSLLNWLFLRNTADDTTATVTAERQLKNGGIVGSIVHGIADLKRPAYAQIRPEIVTVGTSRSTIYRSYFFNRPFYNLAGAATNSVVRHEAELRDIDRTYFSIHKPKLVIMTLDYWAYTKALPALQNEAAAALLVRPLGSVRLHRLYLPSYQLISGRFNTSEFLALALGRIDPDGIEVPRYGATALLRHRGMLDDGSWFNFRVPPVSERFKRNLEALRSVAPVIAADARRRTVNVAQIAGLARMAHAFGEKGIRMVFILAPLASPILAEHRKYPESYSFIDDVRREFERQLPNYYDMLNPAEYGAKDCEFEDGNHGGEVAYLRMLLAIDQSGTGAFAGTFASERARRIVEEYQDLTVTAVSRVGRTYFERFGHPADTGCRDGS